MRYLGSIRLNKADIDQILKNHDYKKSSLISILQDTQAMNSWLPEETLRYISDELDVSLMDVYSLVTFYKSFALHPRGKHIITVCMGTACHVRGAPQVLTELENQLNIEVGQTTPDNNFTLETVRCLGTCAIGPVVTIDGKYHGQMNSKKIHSIIKKMQAKT